VQGVAVWQGSRVVRCCSRSQVRRARAAQWEATKEVWTMAKVLEKSNEIIQARPSPMFRVRVG